jgi:F0F1-type ATP synthase assembly protein I
VNRPDEPRSKLAVGIEWASRVTTVGFMFALPPLLGAWLDQWRGTSPLGVLFGAVLGFGAGMAQVLRIAREESDRQRGGAGGPGAG